MAALQSASAGVGRGLKLLGVSALGALVVTGVAWKLACSDCSREGVGNGPSVVPSLMAAGSGSPAIAPVAAGASGAGALRAVPQIEDAVFVKGSLRGTEFPAWGTARGEAVKPNRALRDRFDHYLLAMSEASLSELTLLVKTHAERDLGAAAAADILVVWARYLQLQQHAFQVIANPRDAMSMQAALQEHRQVRQSMLGVHWAAAFYGDEEKTLATDIENRLNGILPARDPERALYNPPPGTDPQVLHAQRVKQFGPDAARRLADVDREQAAWAQRIDTTKAQVERLQNAPELSSSQRVMAISQVLDAAFPNPTERLRASGLVGAD